MPTSVFFSFHYDGDHARAQLVRNINAFTAQEELAPQKWEAVRKGGPTAISKWIQKEMSGKGAVIVLVGSETASRPWVNYEIKKAWNDRVPLVGIRIHGLSAFGRTSYQGANPFGQIQLSDGSLLSTYVELHAPSGLDSRAKYNDVAAKIGAWASAATRRGTYDPTA
jgi:MTH538 TIR-like domain (DUF1863)